VSNVLDRPRSAQPAAVGGEPIASIWLRGTIAAVWAVAVGVASLIVLALVVWAADSKSTASAGGAIRFAAQLWVLAHRSPLRMPSGGAVTIPPLMLTGLAGLLVARGAAILARGMHRVDRSSIGMVAAAVATPYAILAAVVAGVTASSTFRPSIGAAFICALLIGGISATLGAAKGAGLIGVTWRSLPAEWRECLEATGLALAVLLGVGALLAVGSLVAHAHQFGSIVGGYDGGPGEFSMVLLSLLYLPNAACFGIGYLAGPGFAIGAGTSVAYGGTSLGALPAFPLLAATPHGPAPLPVLTLSILGLLLAGGAAGRRIAMCRGLDITEVVRRAVISAALTGVTVALLVGFAGGPAGPGRLREVGPSPWQVGLVVTGEILLTAVAVVLVATWSDTGRRWLRTGAPSPG
jgi:hypothetical protein